MAENDAAYDKVKSSQKNSAHAKKVLAGAGYARGGGVSPMKEKKTHDDKKEAKLKKGGKVSGEKPKARADKFARGGSVPKGHHTTKININMAASQADKKQALMQGVQLGAKAAASKMGGGPRPGAGAPMQARSAPMPGGAPGGPPPGGAPGGDAMGGGPSGVPPTMKRGGCAYKRGGKVGAKKVPGVTNLKTGAGGGEGRLEKIAKYGTKPKA